MYIRTIHQADAALIPVVDQLKFPLVVIIYGPTGVGKTAFVDQLARHVSVEIINMDMGQQYKTMSVGTAKPDIQNASVPHHLFDTLAEPMSTTVVAYRKAVMEKIAEIRGRQAVPVLVGGSGFYLKSLLFPPQEKAHVTLSPKHEYNQPFSWQDLAHIDPDRAQKIHPQDHYRIERALAIWRETGNKPSAFRPHYNPIAPYYLYCITRNRNDLYERINKRVYEMLDAGWLQEVRSLRSSGWEDFICAKKIIGYQELFEVERGHIGLDQAIACIQKRTRNYAKRQMTFWRMLERTLVPELMSDRQAHIRTLNLTEVSVSLYIDQLLSDISS